MKKIKPPKHKQQSNLKKTLEEATDKILKDHNNLISFSFKYLDVTEKFNPYSRDVNYFRVMLDRLGDFNGLTPDNLFNNHSKAIRCHGIDFTSEKVSEDSFGLTNEDQLVRKPYQFAVSANEYGRVHGFFIGNTFCIRWFDPEHKLYP